MAEISRRVPKSQAIKELGISLSTLDRMIRDEKVEVVRQGSRVYVLLEGQEPVSDRELLEAARAELAMSEQTVLELQKNAGELEATVEQIELDLGDARRTIGDLSKELDKERDERNDTTIVAVVLSLTTIISHCWPLRHSDRVSRALAPE